MYYHVNKSSYQVAISVENNPEDIPGARVVDSIMEPGDTIQYYDRPFEGFTGPFSFIRDSNASVTLRASGNGSRCLVFTGAVENKGYDIRSPIAYETTDTGGARFVAYYVITDEHFENASICD